MKKILYMLTAVSVILTSCSSNPKKDSSETAHHHEGHEHIYACPMHPEVRGKEGDMCSKCGMPLEHMDEKATKGNYKMAFKSSEAPEAEKPVQLSLMPQDLDNPDAQVALDTEHEKKIHLILVSEDLRWFDHIHPEYDANGTYNVTETFPYAGHYFLFADYKPSGGMHKVDQIPVTVSGKAAPKHKDIITKSLVYLKDGLMLKLEPDQEFTSGKETHIRAVLSDKGKALDAATLENYLGAKAHVVMIGKENKDYIHVHPQVSNGGFDLNTSFTNPGTYRVWVQFMYKGAVQTADFTVPVKQGTLLNAGHEDHNH